MMMRMLEAGGLAVLADGERKADDDNPRGYFELEAVKRTKGDESWLDAARGKTVKVISQLLKDLPRRHKYRVIFMRRPLEEVLKSQKTMLDRRGEDQSESDEKMRDLFVAHLEEVESYMRGRDDFSVLFVNYKRMVEDPKEGARKINAFLGGALDEAKMIAAVEPTLYRNRS